METCWFAEQWDDDAHREACIATVGVEIRIHSDGSVAGSFRAIGT